MPPEDGGEEGTAEAAAPAGGGAMEPALGEPPLDRCVTDDEREFLRLFRLWPEKSNEAILHLVSKLTSTGTTGACLDIDGAKDSFMQITKRVIPKQLANTTARSRQGFVPVEGSRDKRKMYNVTQGLSEKRKTLSLPGPSPNYLKDESNVELLKELRLAINDHPSVVKDQRRVSRDDIVPGNDEQEYMSLDDEMLHFVNYLPDDRKNDLVFIHPDKLEENIDEILPYLDADEDLAVAKLIKCFIRLVKWSTANWGMGIKAGSSYARGSLSRIEDDGYTYSPHHFHVDGAWAGLELSKRHIANAAGQSVSAECITNRAKLAENIMMEFIDAVLGVSINLNRAGYTGAHGDTRPGARAVETTLGDGDSYGCSTTMHVYFIGTILNLHDFADETLLGKRSDSKRSRDFRRKADRIIFAFEMNDSRNRPISLPFEEADLEFDEDELEFDEAELLLGKPAGEVAADFNLFLDNERRKYQDKKTPKLPKWKGDYLFKRNEIREYFGSGNFAKTYEERFDLMFDELVRQKPLHNDGLFPPNSFEDLAFDAWFQMQMVFTSMGVIRADHLSRLKDLYNADAPNDWVSFSRDRVRESIVKMPSSKHAMFAQYMPLEDLAAMDRLKCICGIVHAKHRYPNQLFNVCCGECEMHYEVIEKCIKKKQKWDRHKIFESRMQNVSSEEGGEESKEGDGERLQWLCLDCKPESEYENRADGNGVPGDEVVN